MMSMTAEKVLNQALSLPEEDRTQIAEALIASIYQDRELRLDEEVLALVEKREAELESGAVTSIPWEEAKRRLRSVTDA